MGWVFIILSALLGVLVIVPAVLTQIDITAFVRHPRAGWEPEALARHPRAGGEPETKSTALDSRLRGNDGSKSAGDLA